MVSNPLFLSQEDLISFKRDTCIFCNLKFNTKLIEKIGNEKRGDHYAEHCVEVLRRNYLISDLNIYSFDFKFDSESEDYLNTEEIKTVKKIKTQKQEEAPKLRQKLESQFSIVNLEKGQKELAINAIVGDYLFELQSRQYKHTTALEDRVAELFHNIRLGDLSFVFKRTGFDVDYSKESDNPKFDVVRYYCNPLGLKTHKKCWPFENFDKFLKSSFHLKEFFEHIKKNPRFENYESLFEDFPDLWKNVLEKTKIMINAKTYNPTDYID